jgi:ABC-type Zn2+ transport system substrate-binding protein/surface adhesin
MSRKAELKSRVEAGMQQLKADLAKAKADAQGKKNDNVEKLEARLAEVSQTMKDGWENVSEDVAAKLNKMFA